MTHIRCDLCHQWYVEGDDHAEWCSPVAPAKEGEALCERCEDSFPLKDLCIAGYCADCNKAIDRAMAGDLRAYGFGNYSRR